MSSNAPRGAATYRARRRIYARKTKQSWRDLPLRRIAITKRQRVLMRVPKPS